MAESLYRRNPEGNIIEVLKGRRSLMNRPQTGGESPSVRNPAYVILTGRDKSCGGGGSMTLPRNQTKVQTVYNYSGGSIKPGPDIESCTIE